MKVVEKCYPVVLFKFLFCTRWFKLYRLHMKFHNKRVVIEINVEQFNQCITLFEWSLTVSLDTGQLQTAELNRPGRNLQQQDRR